MDWGSKIMTCFPGKTCSIKATSPILIQSVFTYLFRSPWALTLDDELFFEKTLKELGVVRIVDLLNEKCSTC